MDGAPRSLRKKSGRKPGGQDGHKGTTLGQVTRPDREVRYEPGCSTPNSLAEDEEYRELCEFAIENGAAYVLMNPLSSMGRGVKSRARLAAMKSTGISLLTFNIGNPSPERAQRQLAWLASCRHPRPC